jgi:5'-nucleotidase
MQRSSRRNFLKTVAIAGAGTLAGFAALGQRSRAPSGSITILHTNDTHSRLDPWPDNDPNFPSMCGYARRASMVRALRDYDPQLLLLDAGDIFQGTPYYNMFGGEPELRLMSKMGYDAATLGNHEFDNGLQGLDEVLGFAGFPFVSSNYDFSDTILKAKIKDHLVLERNGIRIGIYGLGIELNGLVARDLYQGTVYLDPLATALKMEEKLKIDHDCQLIICISHLGYKYAEIDRISDLVVAANTRYTDIIIGGHTHSLLETPSIINNKRSKRVYIGQTGYGGVRLGKMEVFFNHQKELEIIESSILKICKKQEL